MRGHAAFALAGLLMGFWALLAPYVGPSLDLDPRVEVADHVVPGMVVIVVSAAFLLGRHRVAPRSTPMFAAGLVIALTGLWISPPTCPCWPRPTTGWCRSGRRCGHSVPGLVVMALGGLWAVRNGAEPEEGSGGREG